MRHILIAGIDIDADLNKTLDPADWNMFSFIADMAWLNYSGALMRVCFLLRAILFFGARFVFGSSTLTKGDDVQHNNTK